MTAMIDISDARKSFVMHLQGGIELPVVRGVSFRVEPGECVVLSGPSGAGKSSILKMIFGNYRCDGGRIGIRHRGEIIDLATAEPREVIGVVQRDAVLAGQPLAGVDLRLELTLQHRRIPEEIATLLLDQDGIVLPLDRTDLSAQRGEVINPAHDARPSSVSSSS